MILETLLLVCCFLSILQGVNLFKNTKQDKENILHLSLIIAIQIVIVISAFLFNLKGFNMLIIISIVLLFVILYFVVKACIKMMLNKDNDINENIKGKEGIVIEDIDNIQGSGLIKILGEIWSAKTYDKEIIKKGTIVLVEKVEGVRAVVSKK